VELYVTTHDNDCGTSHDRDDHSNVLCLTCREEKNASFPRPSPGTQKRRKLQSTPGATHYPSAVGVQDLRFFFSPIRELWQHVACLSRQSAL
jgi:hypothetical protein